MDIKEFNNHQIKEKILFSKTKNGLNIYFMPKKGYTKKYAIFSTNYGSIDNKFIPIGEKDILKVPEGIAHFLEHKLFEEPKVNIFDKFSKMGADVNAFTNFTQTSYLFTSTDYFYENLELLVNFVQNPYLTDENVEKEKGIIAQEIKMYEDSPGWRVYFNLLEAMYVDHPVKIDIAGTVESINTINKELLYKSYNTFYNPSNMVLFIVGDLSFDRIMEVINKAEKEYGNLNKSIERIFDIEPNGINKKIIEERMFTASPIFHIGFKDTDLGYNGEKKVKKDIVTNIILDILIGASSSFYNELYDEGLIDTSFGGYYTGKKLYGHSIIGGQSNNPEEVYERLMELISKPVNEILKEKDFNRIKSKDLGSFLLGLNSIEFIANNFTDLYFDDFLIIDYLDLLSKVQYEDIVNRFNEHFTQENVALSIIRPLEV
ncbi:EF-P 5-aminopentanol modification-associated protein YfmH [Wansuia hejianensis]|uniref:EF-P 5-aminopentanol modification-associated protein YfmH n=1 Tax=Wansuia hejianensis TaxID=2763667 RepID=UPI0020161C98